MQVSVLWAWWNVEAVVAVAASTRLAVASLSVLPAQCCGKASPPETRPQSLTGILQPASIPVRRSEHNKQTDTDFLMNHVNKTLILSNDRKLTAVSFGPHYK